MIKLSAKVQKSITVDPMESLKPQMVKNFSKCKNKIYNKKKKKKVDIISKPITLFFDLKDY